MFSHHADGSLCQILGGASTGEVEEVVVAEDVFHAQDVFEVV